MITLRDGCPTDDLFFCQLYATTRAEEMALVDWSEPEKVAFLTMQFNAQRSSYLLHYPQASYKVISQDETSIGRLIINRTESQILLMDIALLPA